MPKITMSKIGIPNIGVPKLGVPNRAIALALTTALATTVVSGCASKASPQADVSASRAQNALAKGEANAAITHAEQAVLAEPRNASYRAMLGAVYMESGRFQAAATSFDDAMSLGDNSPRTALSLALATVAVGDNGKAQAVLNDWRADLDAADYGLAISLAGRPDIGAEVLSDTLRSGRSTAKVRQNLAYAHALMGNWREARVMASEDLPANQVGDRMNEWSQMAQPEDFHKRVAHLLQVPMVSDAGQPAQLALSNTRAAEQLAAEASAIGASAGASDGSSNGEPVALAAADKGELPALYRDNVNSDIAPEWSSAMAQAMPTAGPTNPVESYPLQQIQTGPKNFEQAFAAEAPKGASLAQIAQNAIQFVSNPVVMKTPERFGVAPAQTAPKAAASNAPMQIATVATPSNVSRARTTAASRGVPMAGPALSSLGGISQGSHLVQLGSFSSEAGARRAWGIFVKRHPQLSKYDMVITQAEINGKTYHRVSAGGLAAPKANALCSTVKSSGNGCFSWAYSRPLPGAVGAPVRLARR